jgi:hypothetical protein
VHLLPVTLLFFISSAIAQPSIGSCVYLLQSQDEVKFASQGLEVNRVPAIIYDLNFSLSNLKLSREDLRQMDGNILLLGEGFSPILPTLVEMGKNVKAVDIVYGLSEIPDELWYAHEYREYLDRYRTHLIATRAQDLAVPDHSQNFILSHMLLSGLSSSRDLFEILKKSVRALAPSGIAIFAWYSHARNLDYLIRFMSVFPQDEIRYEFSSNNKDEPYISDDELFDTYLQTMAGALPPRWNRDHSKARVQVLRIERVSQ